MRLALHVRIKGMRAHPWEGGEAPSLVLGIHLARPGEELAYLGEAMGVEPLGFP